MNLLLIALGGALGTLLRYATTLAAHRWTERFGFPFGTLLVNLSGCFLIGYLHGLFVSKSLPEAYRLPLVVGFLGGFTTFSSFGSDMAQMMSRGEYTRASVNFLANNVLGVALVFAGWALARGRT